MAITTLIFLKTQQRGISLSICVHLEDFIPEFWVLRTDPYILFGFVQSLERNVTVTEIM
jgi:hypothetical protein